MFDSYILQFALRQLHVCIISSADLVYPWRLYFWLAPSPAPILYLLSSLRPSFFFVCNFCLGERMDTTKREDRNDLVKIENYIEYGEIFEVSQTEWWIESKCMWFMRARSLSEQA